MKFAEKVERGETWPTSLHDDDRRDSEMSRVTVQLCSTHPEKMVGVVAGTRGTWQGRTVLDRPRLMGTMGIRSALEMVRSDCGAGETGFGNDPARV